MHDAVALTVLLAMGVVCSLFLIRWFLSIQARRASVAWIGMLALLMVLAGCSGASTTSTATPTPKATATPSPTAQVATPTSGVTATPTPNTGTNWPTYHYDSSRTGYVAGVPDPKQLSRAWKAAVDGAVYAEPLVINGQVIVATENDTLYALDESKGTVTWHTNIGTPVSRSTLPCGNIDPLGITSTPVYDPLTKLIFIVGEVSTGSGPQHIMVGIDLNGSIKVRRQIDIAGMDIRAYQQRAGLALFQNYLYIGLGGLAGDCSDYIGKVVGARTDGQGDLLYYQVPTTREGAIWATAGPSIDNAGNVYVSVGNGEVSSGVWDHSDSVLRLSPTLQLQDAFAPAEWASENTNDLDLGSTSPLLLPNGLVFIAGKSGKGYILHANALGGVGGQAFVGQICSGVASGGDAVVGSQIFVPCNEGAWEVKLSGTQFTRGWQAVGVLLPPVVAGHTLYGLDFAGTLYAYNIDTGALRLRFALDDTPGFTVPHFATPTVINGRIFVGTMNNSVIAVNIG